MASETGSPVLPFLDTSNPRYPQPLNDWTYTWMFTGYRSGVGSNLYIGDIVIFHNRAIDDETGVADLFNQSVRAFKGKSGG